MHLRICPICSAVSGTWLILTALVLAGYLPSETFLPLIALLMGGTVVGIAYRFEKQRPLIIGAGMLLAFLAVRNMTFPVFLLELVVVAGLAYFLFFRKIETAEPQNKKARESLEEKMKRCC
ncbi:hypothetical protein A2661_02925 [Candidatus Giovannonibacteria bacterium RIFCSPHIGHO2_01_FULL_45_24]|uniref:Uncharacterized protein n=1 Tax=Candidatus Giovannonibacteria bacterium RIFCSPLOWO2_01_FULL_46_32 TaxID=1798353 RepID=A0A1F5XGM7_9BACT|nr:MAG: hypothetical protein A2661_02925 [Candidatus Giovannonibacteria bacterium RIFCSPHIGHO2_01_FULL_45_24]OGF86966.1 MAG: hypothetical protein A3B19_00845 [Candidatus Giovannonibacteria bacterium RIFCSPLOWO2_01_FULL_46_32]